MRDIKVTDLRVVSPTCTPIRIEIISERYHKSKVQRYTVDFVSKLAAGDILVIVSQRYVIANDPLHFGQ